MDSCGKPVLWLRGVLARHVVRAVAGTAVLDLSATLPTNTYEQVRTRPTIMTPECDEHRCVVVQAPASRFGATRQASPMVMARYGPAHAQGSSIKRTQLRTAGQHACTCRRRSAVCQTAGSFGADFCTNTALVSANAVSGPEWRVLRPGSLPGVPDHRHVSWGLLDSYLGGDCPILSTCGLVRIIRAASITSASRSAVPTGIVLLLAPLPSGLPFFAGAPAYTPRKYAWVPVTSQQRNVSKHEAAHRSSTRSCPGYVPWA